MYYSLYTGRLSSVKPPVTSYHAKTFLHDFVGFALVRKSLMCLTIIMTFDTWIIGGETAHRRHGEGPA